MKIDRFNIPDYNFNELKNNPNTQANRADFGSRLENLNAPAAQASASPLQSDLTTIAKATNFNSPASTKGAIDQASRAIVGSLLSPEIKNSVNVDRMLAKISDFAQNDPMMSQKLQKLLTRLS